MKSGNRRRSARRRVLLQAEALIDNGGLLRCAVFDLSDHGARLRL